MLLFVNVLEFMSREAVISKFSSINAEPAFCYLLRRSTQRICYTISGNNKKFICPLNSHLIKWLSDIFFLLPGFQFTFSFPGFMHCLSPLLFLLMAYFLPVAISSSLQYSHVSRYSMESVLNPQNILFGFFGDSVLSTVKYLLTWMNELLEKALTYHMI